MFNDNNAFNLNKIAYLMSKRVAYYSGGYSKGQLFHEKLREEGIELEHNYIKDASYLNNYSYIFNDGECFALVNVTDRERERTVRIESSPSHRNLPNDLQRIINESGLKLKK